ncbi:MAG TPA: diguanylate cyclase [Gaiellaceae bacterium]|nr:diguanylate cyclase [Gaiellaceae bacterium]
MTALLAISVGALLAYSLYVLLQVEGELASLVFDRVLYNVGLVASGLVCLARGLGRKGQVAWAWIGVGILLWAAATIYWTIFLINAEDAPYPSPADALYLAFYVPTYIGIGLLVRSSHGRLPAALWLDGLIAALVVAAIAVAVVFDQVLAGTDGAPAAVATNLTYPLADAVLLAFVVGLLAVGGWRVSRSWVLLTTGLGLFAVADSYYLYAIATESYDTGSLVDIAWIAGFTLVALAAWQSRGRALTLRPHGWRVLVVPAAFALVGVGLLTVDHFERLHILALSLVSLSLVLVVVRLALTFGAHQRLLEQSVNHSLTDSLTGLWNRRALVAHLEDVLAGERPHVFALFDLDGFKSYNDSFGHPAGDDLLRRIAGNLQRAVVPHGRAYRLGGDEFCILAPDDGRTHEPVAAAAKALEERGERFLVTASVGVVGLPGEADSWGIAMQLADERLYERKRGRPSASRQIRTALLAALAERDDELDGHVHDVAALAEALGRNAGLEPDELEDVRAAAELHDIGKMAIPDSILFKPGTLDEEEMMFIRRHTVVGERIVAGVPALARVAHLVRSSHEWWNGTGYPDGLRGTAIPSASRMIAVCDAFVAMTSERPFSAIKSVEAALTELERCAGTQFDPAIVAAFPEALAATDPSIVAAA